MSQKVAVSKITTDRDLGPGDDITDLAKHISTTGLEVPLLVTSNYQVIDGIRRLAAIRSLGWEEVEVTPALLYPVACHSLKQARLHGVLAQDLTPLRIWQLYRDLTPMVPVTHSHARLGVRRAGPKPNSPGGLRGAIKDALDITESVLQAITQVFRMAEEDPTERGDRARASRQKVISGEMTIYMAAESIRPSIRGIRDLRVSAAQQRQSWESLVSTLRGLSHSLDRFGAFSPKISNEEIEGWLASLRQFRRKYAGFIHQVEKEINNRD